jgi:perosamine synthetase
MTNSQVESVASPASDRIPISGPWITELEVDYVADAARTAWYEHAGDYVNRFEQAFAAYTGRRHAIALPSCTSGLHLALAAAGVKAGDKVAVPEITWIASAAPVTYVGAEPVFVDVDPESWCMSADSFAAVAPEVTAAIPVDLYGNMPDWGAISEAASEHGVFLIEDAAEAIGSLWSGRPAGAFGDASAFSFHGSKTLTTGEGGMLTTDSDEIYERCRFLADHGRTPGDVSFRNTEVAFKYKMSAMQAALGLAQLERVESLVERKRLIFDWYREALAGVEEIELNHEAPDVRNSYWMVTAVWSSESGPDKLEIMSAMAKDGIDTRPFFSPLSTLDAYRDASDRARAEGSNPVAHSLANHALNLPSGLLLERSQVERVAESLKRHLTG